MDEQEERRNEHRRNIERFIAKMPSLSTTTSKVLEICSRADASPNELNRVISLDPVLTGQVLKLINSAYYSLANKVTSLTRAITMLGMNTVKNMALSTAVIRAVTGGKKSQALPTAAFWKHSLAVGVAAKLLGVMREVAVGEREELFVAGLLHDLGKVPFGDEYIAALRLARDEQRPLIEVENEILGMNHQEIGLLIAERWKLNEMISLCIGHHHDNPPPSNKVVLVSLADVFVNIHEFGGAGNAFPAEDELTCLLAALSMDQDGLRPLSEQLLVEIRRAEVFLEL
ncbi:MAG: HDOD domain-containing protein [Desulfobulbaceae bacterium]|nr:HDOD domain-containing protein [Desulfobulbaceae bacterium]